MNVHSAGSASHTGGHIHNDHDHDRGHDNTMRDGGRAQHSRDTIEDVRIDNDSRGSRIDLSSDERNAVLRSGDLGAARYENYNAARYENYNNVANNIANASDRASSLGGGVAFAEPEIEAEQLGNAIRMFNFGESPAPEAEPVNAQQQPQSTQAILQTILSALQLLVQLIASLFGGAAQGQPSNSIPTGSDSSSGVSANNDSGMIDDESMLNDDMAMSDSSGVEQEAEDPFNNARTGQVFESSKVPGLKVFAGDQDPEAAEILLKTLEGMYYKNPDLKDRVDSVVERDGDISFTVQDLPGNDGMLPQDGGNDNLVDISNINERGVLSQGITQNNIEVIDRGPAIESEKVPGLKVYQGDQSPEDAQILLDTIEGNYYTDSDFKAHIDSVLAENDGEYNFTVVADSDLPEGRDYSAESGGNEAQISADWVNARGNIARAVVENAGIESGTEEFEGTVATSVDNL